MRTVRILALATVVLAAAPVFAQDSFPDVPANHWAYDALLRMKKDGLLVGYPDGLFRGGRPASRYELAVAMHAVYTNLKNVTDALDAQIKAVNSNQNLATTGEVSALKDAIAGLQADLAVMKGYGADIADLRRASDTFEKELTQLGVNVQAMKDDLRDLSGRVKKLEDKKDTIEISGELDFWLGGGHGAGDHYGMSRDGRLTGISDKNSQGVVFPATERTGITDDLAFLTEAALTFTSTNASGLKFEGTVVATNAFGQNPIDGVVTGNIGFGNQSDVFNPTNGNAGSPGLFGYSEGSGDLYLQKLAFTYSAKGFDTEFGRVEHKATPWILQRIDNTLYFDDERWDNGKYLFDGAIVDTKIGPVKAQFYGGIDNERSVNGVRIDTIRTGAALGTFGPDGGNRLEAERILGGTLKTSVKGVGLRGDYLIVDSNEPVTGTFGSFDHLDVYGGEADFNVGRFKVSGGLRQTKAYNNDVHVEGLVDGAWDAKVAWASGKVDVWAQYREIGLNYLAPGDWGRLGIWRNPTNIRGFVGSAKLGLTPRYSLSVDGELSHGLDNGDASGSLFDRDTDIDRYNVRLDAKVGSNCNAFVYYENTSFSGLVPPSGGSIDGSPRYQWYGIGVVHGIGGNARFSLAYEQSALRDDYQSTLGFGTNSFRGGFLTSQLTVKF